MELHVLPVAQSSDFAQDVKHCAGPHAYGAQLVDGAAMQAPLPSQLCDASRPFEHALPHGVSAAG